ncbi:DUF7563 family protein [Natrialba aegyptia]
MTAHCQNCGAHHTEQYARVFGNNDGVLYNCSECRDVTAMFRGAGVEGI